MTSLRFPICFALVLCVVQILFSTRAEAQQASSSSVEPSQVARRYLPPSDGPVEVRAAFHIHSVNEIDDEAETFEFTGVLVLTWHDPRQAFDPERAGVPEILYHGAYQFNELDPAWYPQVVLANVSGLYEKTAVLLRIAPDGTCTLIEKVNAVAEASFNLRKYPFDAQRLEAVFEIIGFDTDEVVLHAEPVADPQGKELPRIPQWTVTGLSISAQDIGALYAAKNGTTSAFTITVDVTRKPLFVLRMVVGPLMLIVMLSWSVFWMDQSALGDRMSVSFVGVLTAVAYQVVIGDILPHISYMTLVNGFLNASFILMSASVVVNLRVGLLDKRGQTERGDRLDRRCRWIFPAVYFGWILGTVTMTLLIF